MRARVDLEAFRAAVTAAARVAVDPKKAQYPILAYALVEATGDQQLCVTATDLEVVLRCAMAAEVQISGAIAVQSALLLQIAGGLTHDDLWFEQDRRETVIRAANTYSSSRFALHPLHADEFFHVPQRPVAEQWVCEMSGSELVSTLRRCEYAASRRDELGANAVFAGVNIVLARGAASIAATDGARLARHVLPVDATRQESLIIPRSAIRLAGSLLSDEEPVQVSVDAQNLHIKQGGLLLTARTMLGTFPDTSRSFTPLAMTVLRFEREALIRALRLALVISGIDRGELRRHIEIDIYDDDILVSSAASLASGTTRVDCIVDGPSGMHFDFDGRLLLDAVQNVSTDHLTMEIESPGVPVTLRPVGGTHDESHVVFPRTCPRATPIKPKESTPDAKPANRRRVKAACH